MVYQSQNDPRWGDVTIGASHSRLAEFGCTISCVSTGGSWFGEVKNPDVLAKKLKFQVDKVIWSSIGEVYKSMKFLWRFYTPDVRLIDEALKNKDKVVLLNVAHGRHWVFALRKIPLLGYRCSDPWTYPARVKYYKSNEIVGGAILCKK